MTHKFSMKLLIAGLGLLLLAGCSSTTPKAGAESTTATSTSDSATDKTSTNGLGQDSGFDSKGAKSGKGAGMEGNTKALRVGNQTYYFDYDKSGVHDADRASIEVQAKYLASHPNAKVLLEGNTDPRGSREYNIALGERRAKAVADVLKLQGVAVKQIRLVSYGAEKLASQGHSDDDYQLDRRVNLVYEAK